MLAACGLVKLVLNYNIWPYDTPRDYSHDKLFPGALITSLRDANCVIFDVRL